MQAAPISAAAPVVPIHPAPCASIPVSACSKDTSSRTLGALAAVAAASCARNTRLGKVGRWQQARQTGEDEKEDANVAQFMKNFNKKYGEGSIVSLQQENMNVPTFSTGALTLDLVLGGGIPYGRIIEVFGPEQSGKTTLALSCAYQAQTHGNRKRVAFLDAEQALDTTLAENMGINLAPDWFSMISAGFAEEACDMMLDLAASEQYDLIILDSVAALTPKEELEKDMTQHTMGLLARNMSKFLRKAAKIAKDGNTTLLLINQCRANIGGYGPAETTCGGKALPYAASMRLEVRSPMSGKTGPVEEPTGIRSVVRVKKNKLAAPHRMAEFDIFFGKGISWESSVAEAGVKRGLVNKAGAWMQYGEHKVQGKDKLRVLLEENPDICKTLEQDVRASMRRSDSDADAGSEVEASEAESIPVEEPATAKKSAKKTATKAVKEAESAPAEEPATAKTAKKTEKKEAESAPAEEPASAKKTATKTAKKTEKKEAESAPAEEPATAKKTATKTAKKTEKKEAESANAEEPATAKKTAKKTEKKEEPAAAKKTAKEAESMPVEEPAAAKKTGKEV